MKKLNYAIFDMDGTLLESMQYWRTIVLDLVDRFGIEVPSSLREEIVYHSFNRAVALLKEKAPHPALDQCTPAVALEIMDAHYQNDVTVRGGVRELLDALAARGVRMCLFSATPTEIAKRALARHELDRYFEMFLSPIEIPGGKSDPESFREVCRRFGTIEPSECYLFEDALYSIKTAKPLGFYAVATEDALQVKNKDAILALCDEYYTDGFKIRVK